MTARQHLHRFKTRMICRLRGHDYHEARQVFLPARECSRCGKRQVKLPDIAATPGWHDSLI